MLIIVFFILDHIITTSLSISIMLSVGLVGLPNAGKSSLFNLLTERAVPAENFPFTTIDPNDGVVEVPDTRLDKLAEIVSAKKVTKTAIEFRDIAGLIKNAHAGEGLGNQFLSHIREVDLILLVLRKFESSKITHVENRVDPKGDEEILLAELALTDEKSMENIIPKLQKEARKDKSVDLKLEIAEKIQAKLSNLELASSYALPDNTDEELVKWRKSLNLLTDKPLLRLGNINLDGDNVEYDTDFDLDVLLETDMAGMNPEERAEFGATGESGMDLMIQACYETLGLSTFLTAGEIEARAWTFRNGSTAPEAAAVIHTDFQKKFVKAEIAKYEDFVAGNGWKGAKESGKVRAEGKTYVMQDGDVTEFVIGG